EDLLRLARLLSGRQVDATAAPVPADPSDLRRAWEILRRRYPAQFTASPADVADWQAREVEAALKEAVADERTENWQADLAQLSKAIELEPGEAGLRSRRGNVYARLRQWKRAVADFAKAVELQPDVAANRTNMALCQSTVGDVQGYRKTCADALARFGNTHYP